MVLSLSIDAFIDESESFMVADLILGTEQKTEVHNHDFYEFYVVLEGSFHEWSGSKKRIIQQGDLHFVHPEDEHCFIGHGQSVNRLRNVAVRKEYFESICKKTSSEPIGLGSDFLRLRKQALNSFTTKSDLLLGVTFNVLEALFIFENLLGDLIIETVNMRQLFVPPWLSQACMEMQEDDNSIIGLSKLLQLCGRSQEHVSREMKKYYKMTPTDFVNDIRISKAANRIIASEDRILDISLEVGFSNTSYFNRLFKEKYGVTPRKYRANNVSLFSK